MPKEDPFVNRAQLLKAIKKYPEIWDSNNKLHMCRSVTAPLWNEIAEQFGGHVPTVKLQSIWSQMKYHYHNLVHRQILHKERFTTKWEHFEPMSFMYNITVAKIVGTATANAEGNQIALTTQSVATATTTVSPTATTSETISPPPPPPLPPPTPPASTSASASAPAGPPQSVAASLSIIPAVATLATSHHHGRGRPSGTFTSWLPPSNQQQQEQHQHPHQHPHHQQQQQQQQQHLQNQLESSAIHQARSPHMHTTSTVEPPSPQFTDFSGLVPPAAVTVETTTTTLRKPGRPGSLNNSMRGRIIDAIKAHPAIWAGRQREQQPRTSGQSPSQNRTSSIWKEIAAELGLTPSLVQTRWSIIKQRYVDELQKERHSEYTQQGFRSSWEHFDRMSFMRDILTKKVDEREQTREHIQEIVSEQQQQQNHHHLQQQQQHQQQQQQQQHQQQHHQQHHQHHQQLQQAHLLRYTGRPPPLQHSAMMMSGGLAGLPCGVTSGGLVAAAAAAAAAGHPLTSLCDDMSGTGIAGPGIGGPGVDVSGMLPMHLSSVIGRRRVKTESDLEWDPFEMILQVHGTEPAAN